MLGALVPGGTHVKCNQQCHAGYSADEDDCRYQYGTPADTDALANCIREARDDYRNCLDDCAGAAISLPGWRILRRRHPHGLSHHCVGVRRAIEGRKFCARTPQGNARGAPDGQFAGGGQHRPYRCSSELAAIRAFVSSARRRYRARENRARRYLPRHAHSPLTIARCNMAPISGARRVVESLKRALSWLVVFAVGLAPMLVYSVAGLIGRVFRRKRGGPRTDSRPLETVGEERHHRGEAAPPW
jgi:hypothetical protein